MKDKIALLLLGIFVICFSSCLGNDDESTYIPSGDAQVYYFHLQNDSIPALDSVKFTIDQLNGTIYNPDSMAYGTVIDEKAVCTFTTRGVAGIQVKQTALADTLSWWNTTDSLDFTKPVEFIVTPMDGIHKKPYTAWINIHTVNPDSMTWDLLTSDFFGVTDVTGENTSSLGVVADRSDNGTVVYRMFMRAENNSKNTLLQFVPEGNEYTVSTENVQMSGFVGGGPVTVDWEQLTAFNGKYLACMDTSTTYSDSRGKLLYADSPYTTWRKFANGSATGALHVHRILGVLDATDKKPARLAVVIKGADKKYYFACTQNLEDWETGEEVPDNFPRDGGAARLSYENMYHPYLLLAGGREDSNYLNTVWNTSDGLNWVEYKSSQPPFPEGMVGASLVAYDGMFYLIGGINRAGQPVKSIVCSLDRGLSWQPASDLVVLPQEFKARAYSSVFVTPDNYLLIFSGRETMSTSTRLFDVWKGRINRLGFADAAN